MKILKIENCKGCPFAKNSVTNSDSGGWDYLSTVTCKKIDKPIVIGVDLRFDKTLDETPSWCPLDSVGAK